MKNEERAGESSKDKAQSSREARSDQAPIVPATDVDWLAEESGDSGGLLRDGPPTREPHAWDLLERTAKFGEQIVRFAKRIRHDPVNNRLIDQVVGAGTSVGANYCEANEAVSKKDFQFTISRCVKEAKETKFFLRMIAAAEPTLAESARPLYREAHELLCIFGSMRTK